MTFLNKRRLKNKKKNKNLKRKKKLFRLNQKKENKEIIIYDYKNEYYELIFVCHSTETVQKCLIEYPHSSILFVSQNDLNIDINKHKNIIIVRELKDNIENYPILLSFTAWYAISKNKLFSDKEYLCIFEYDVHIDNSFLQKIDKSIKDHQPNCLSFVRNLDGHKFEADINIHNIRLFVDEEYPQHETWYPTTNHCLKRNLLDNFVNWYYPKCIYFLLKEDLIHLPWYHERLFNVYLYLYVTKKMYIEGLIHIQNNSHNSSLSSIINRTVQGTHNAGFFSCSSLLLDQIIQLFNKYRHLPYFVNSSNVFSWYKSIDLKNKDITYEYYQENNPIDIRYKKNIDYIENYQYSVYHTLQIKEIYPFIEKYFSISEKVKKIKNDLENKYKIDYENTCVFFYRGNDKATEVDLPLYSDYIEYGILIREKEPNIRFMIQSDETEFLDEMGGKFENHFMMKDEIRHMSRCMNTVDKIDSELNFEYSKKYLAITNIMSKCKYLIFGSGNCSIWIVLYRGHSNNIIQHCKGKWYLSI